MRILLCCLAIFPVFAQEEVKPLELYYSPYCYYSLKVIHFLKSINKTVPMKDVVHDPLAKKELIEKGKKAQVPCLFIEGAPLYESDQIILWLSEHSSSLENSSKSNDLLE